MYDVTSAALEWMIEKSCKKKLLISLKKLKKTDLGTIFPVEIAQELFQEFDYNKRIRDDGTTLLGQFFKKQSLLYIEGGYFNISNNKIYAPIRHIPTKQNTDLIELYFDNIACCFWKEVVTFQSVNKKYPLLNTEIIPFFLLYVQDIYLHERFHRLISQILYLNDNKTTVNIDINEGLAEAFAYHQLMFLAIKPTRKMRVFSRTRMEELILHIMPSSTEGKYRLWRNYVEPQKFMNELDKSLKISSYNIVLGKWKDTSLKDFVMVIEPWINWNARERTKFVEFQTGNEILNI